MTAIAYRDGIMAADTMETLGDYVKRLNSEKISRYRDHLIGISGNACPTNADFGKWYFGKERKPWPAAISFTAMVVTPDGVIELWDETGTKTVINERFWSVGSGLEFCIGAMAAGASAREAVRIAIDHCPTVSGKVTWKRLSRKEN